MGLYNLIKPTIKVKINYYIIIVKYYLLNLILLLNGNIKIFYRNLEINNIYIYTKT